MKEIFGQELSIGDYVAFNHYGSFDIVQVATASNSTLRAEPLEVYKIHPLRMNWFLLNTTEHLANQDLFYRTLEIGDQVLVVCNEYELMLSPIHINTFIAIGTVVKQEQSMKYKIKIPDFKAHLFRRGDSVIKIDKTV